MLTRSFFLLSSLLLFLSPVLSISLVSKDSPWDLLLIPGLIFPTPREGHTATRIDNLVFVYGGYYPSRAFWGRDRVPDVVYDQLFVLDLNTFEWSQLGGVPVPEQPFDGFGFFGSSRMSQEEENEDLGKVPTARVPAVTEDEVVTQTSLRFLTEEQIEGMQATTRSLRTGKVTRAESRQTSSDPPGLGNHCAEGINGQLYVFGGLISPGNVASNNLYRFNPVKNTWALLSSGKGPAPRAGATSWTKDDRLYIFGGYDPSLSVAFADTWYYDTKTLKWNLVPTSPLIPGPRVFTTATGTAQYDAVLYSGQTNAPYQNGELANSISVFNSNWTVINPKPETNPKFPLPASDASCAFYHEKDAFASIGGLAGPWALQINRCGWYNPSENNFVGYDAVGDVRIFLGNSQEWERGSDAPFWAFRNLTGRVFGSAAVHYGNNLLFFGGVGCEDLVGRGIKPYPAMYGRFNQIPVYNVYADPRTTISSASSLNLSVYVVSVLVSVWMWM